MIIVAVVRPNTMSVASGDHTADLPVIPSAMGSTPPTVVTVVSIMGRRRFEAASSIASRTDKPLCLA